MLNIYKINNYIVSKISKKSLNDIFVSYEEQKKILEEVYEENFENTYFLRSYC